MNNELNKPKVVGLLGLQGAFRDHIPHLKHLGVAYEIVRDPQVLSRIDGLILPGGESTVMAKFLKESGMDIVLTRAIGAGMPVWGICAGAILLASQVDGAPGLLKALPLAVVRNAYGRQAASGTASIAIPIFNQTAYPGHFIRAPRIGPFSSPIRVLARRDTDPVFIQYGRVMVTTFHPELNDDGLFHDYFVCQL